MIIFFFFFFFVGPFLVAWQAPNCGNGPPSVTPVWKHFNFFHKNDPHWNWTLNNFGQTNFSIGLVHFGLFGRHQFSLKTAPVQWSLFEDISNFQVINWLLLGLAFLCGYISFIFNFSLIEYFSIFIYKDLEIQDCFTRLHIIIIKSKWCCISWPAIRCSALYILTSYRVLVIHTISCHDIGSSSLGPKVSFEQLGVFLVSYSNAAT